MRIPLLETLAENIECLDCSLVAAGRLPAGGQFYEASRESQLQSPARDFHSANYCGNLSLKIIRTESL